MDTTKSDKTVRVFEQDHRTSKPGLHNLHVRWAYEELKYARDAIDQLYGFSRFPASHWAAALQTQVRESILKDAAFFEAAALLYADVELPPEAEPCEEEDGAADVRVP